jgi:hypothetical protein
MWKAGGLLFLRIIQFVLVILVLLPGLFLNSPIFLLSDHISKKKAKGKLKMLKSYDIC